MRRLIVPIVVTLGVSALWAAPFEARSDRYAMQIEMQPAAGNSFEFDVRVIDLATNKVIASPHLRSTNGVQAYEVIDAGNVRVHVRISRAGDRLSAQLDVQQGDVQLDQFLINWTIGPRRVQMNTANALRVGGDVKAPVVVNRVEPQYTPEARKDRISGIVILEVIIDKAGTVQDAVVLKGLPDGLSESAVAAVKQWTFRPGTLNGQPVDVVFTLTVNFKVDTAQD
ncbi:MAG TPA: energy transducer TonB [Thermoanaerobaculia bacterium]